MTSTELTKTAAGCVIAETDGGSRRPAARMRRASVPDRPAHSTGRAGSWGASQCREVGLVEQHAHGERGRQSGGRNRPPAYRRAAFATGGDRSTAARRPWMPRRWRCWVAIPNGRHRAGAVAPSLARSSIRAKLSPSRDAAAPIRRDAGADRRSARDRRTSRPRDVSQLEPALEERLAELAQGAGRARTRDADLRGDMRRSLRHPRPGATRASYGPDPGDPS